MLREAIMLHDRQSYTRVAVTRPQVGEHVIAAGQLPVVAVMPDLDATPIDGHPVFICCRGKTVHGSELADAGHQFAGRVLAWLAGCISLFFLAVPVQDLSWK